MAWISEIMHRNAYAVSQGTVERVEISFSAADLARASDFELVLYNDDGSIYSAHPNLDNRIAYLDNNNGYYCMYINENTSEGNAMGAAEGVALVDKSTSPNTVIDFYDLGAGPRITAATGAAQGAVSTNIAVSSANETIQFGRDGQRIDQGYTANRTFICFCEGTLIETEAGLRPVEALKVGDQIRNDEGDLISLRWVGSRKLNAIERRANPKLHPVRISAGALGNGLPKRDLLVSRQHRILVSSAIAARVAAAEEVLIPAIKLTELPGIYVDQEVEEVSYFHLLFDRHEVIWSEGALTESLFPGPEALKSVSPEAERELMTLFPELGEGELALARPVPAPIMQREIVADHAKQAQALQS